MAEVPSLEEVRSFAREKVLSTLEQRYADGVFSRTLWNEMGKLGLLGITVPEQYGGSGGTPRELAVSVREFAKHGCDLGLTLSWITHLALCVKSIEEHGTERQKSEYLPGLTAGTMVGAVAVSEPATGAHPGGINTTARRSGSGFVIDGAKIYITDGPVADLLIVVAVTGREQGERKELSAFLVESGPESFEARTMDLNFLRTSPHGELSFDGVGVGDEAMLGRPGDAHSKQGKASFARERTLALSALAGTFEACAEELRGGLEEHGDEALGLEGSEAFSWIHHLSALEAYRSLSMMLVEAAFEGGEEWLDLRGLLIYMGISYAKWGQWVSDLAESRQLAGRFPLNLMTKDIRLASVGEGLLMKEGRRRYL